MEAMISPLINVSGVRDVICFKRFFIRRPSAVDTGVQGRVVKQKRRLDLGGVGRGWLAAVEWNRSREIGKPHSQAIGRCSTKTETHDTNFAGAFRTRLQPSGPGHKVFEHFAVVNFTKQFPAFLVVTGISPNRSKTIRRER